MPHVEMTPVTGSETQWTVTVGSHSVTGDYEELCKWIAFLAHAMAYAAGYTSHGEHSQPRNDYSREVLHLQVDG